MPVYQIDIEKSLQPTAGVTNYWTNVYYTNAASEAAAITTGQSVVTLEKQIHANNVTFTKMRTRLVSDLAQTGTVTVLTGTGARTASEYLPLFNVVRIDFGVASGRPNRKYLRLPVLEGDTTSALLTSAMKTLVANSYSTPLINTNAITDKSGQPILTAAIADAVGMRQMRRGSKRKVTPVI